MEQRHPVYNAIILGNIKNYLLIIVKLVKLLILIVYLAIQVLKDKKDNPDNAYARKAILMMDNKSSVVVAI